MSVANLIEAIQATDVARVRRIVSDLKATHKAPSFEFFQAMNEGLPELNGITAMHVACKMYAINPSQRPELEKIIAVLVEHGASIYIPAFLGKGRSEEDSITPLMCCQQQFPKAIREFLDKNNKPSRSKADGVSPQWALMGYNADDLGNLCLNLGWYKKKLAKDKIMQKAMA